MGIDDCFRLEKWPRFIKATQSFNSSCIENIEQHVNEQFEQLSNRYDFSGKRIAVAVGSRGIVALERIVHAVICNLKRYGALPYIIPAMGSHGGANAEGQRLTLELLGITAEAMGAPIVSSMDVEKIAETEDHIPVYVAKDALAADGIIVVNRIKMHTSFRGNYESGLLKMMVVGLGKHAGALLLHGLGFETMAQNLVTLGTEILKRTKIVCGVGIVENAYEKTAEIVVIPAEQILEEEPKLLRLSKSLMPRIPYEKLDILVIRQIGKDISGDGMDPNITGRYTPHTMKPDYQSVPRITRVIAFDLTDASHGSAVGMGHLDAIPQKFKNKIDFDVTYMNSVTATVTNTCKMPIVMPDERGTMEVAVHTSMIADPLKLKICIIEDTLHLDRMIVSEALYHQELAGCNVDYKGDFFDMQFHEKTGELLI